METIRAGNSWSHSCECATQHEGFTLTALLVCPAHTVRHVLLLCVCVFSLIYQELSCYLRIVLMNLGKLNCWVLKDNCWLHVLLGDTHSVPMKRAGKQCACMCVRVCEREREAS